MKRIRNSVHGNRQGSALVLTLIFLVMFSALAVALATVGDTNVQLAENHRVQGNVRACAESGLEIVRYWMNQVSFSGTTAPGQRFAELAATFQSELSAAGITNIVPVLDSSTISLSNVPLDSTSGQSFSAALTKISDDNVQLDVTGHYRSISRTIRSNYVFGTRAHNAFDFGMASKGPISLSGNIELEGCNIDVESNAYIDCDDVLALSIIGNSMIAGEVQIRNGLASVYLQGGKAGVGGEYGVAALEHIEIGAAETEFPEMKPQPFYSYATNVLSATADLSANAVYENLRIPANRNPDFTGQVTLNGVIYIESPNVVRFSGAVSITGIIVTDGDPSFDPDPNDAIAPQIVFKGNVTSYPISQLPAQPQFTGLHEQTGTFMIAPGFRTSFGGSFGMISGAIAANGVTFYGGAGGTINGSIINYSSYPLTLTGNSDLRFNRSGLTQVPAGFVPETILHYDPASYAEVVL